MARRSVDRLAPGVAVSLVDELRNRDLGEIGIAEKLGAIEKCALERLGRQMNALGRAVALLGQIVAFQNVEHLDQSDSARRRRRRADDLVSAIGAANRLALFDLILRQIVGGNQASALLDGRRQLARQRAMVEIVRIVGDALQRLRQLRLLENVAWLVVVAVALEDAMRLGKLRQIGVAEGPGLVVSRTNPSRASRMAGSITCFSESLPQCCWA